MQDKSHSNRHLADSGQTLVEALVAITILIIGLLGLLTLLSNSIGFTRVVADQYIAINLATEGVEIVKNFIDVKVCQNSGTNNTDFNALVPSGIFSIDYDDTVFTTVSSDPNLNDPLEFDGTRYNYNGNGTATKFKRIIFIDSFQTVVVVNSKVVWENRSGSFDVNIEDHFYNWISPGDTLLGC